MTLRSAYLYLTSSHAFPAETVVSEPTLPEPEGAHSVSYDSLSKLIDHLSATQLSQVSQSIRCATVSRSDCFAVDAPFKSTFSLSTQPNLSH